MDAKLIILLAVVGVTMAGVPRWRLPAYPEKPLYWAPKPYDFGYNTRDEYGTDQRRQESGDGAGRVTGSYGYTDPWGISRQVDYVADEFGFRAKVRTNEPGTANQDPADVLVDADPAPGPVYAVKKVVPVHPAYGPRKAYLGPHW